MMFLPAAAGSTQTQYPAPRTVTAGDVTDNMFTDLLHTASDDTAARDACVSLVTQALQDAGDLGAADPAHVPVKPGRTLLPSWSQQSLFGVLAARNDVNGDKQFSAAEIAASPLAARLGPEFALIDGDGDGRLSHGELDRFEHQPNQREPDFKSGLSTSSALEWAFRQGLRACTDISAQWLAPQSAPGPAS